jgi:hypothetical protein
MSFGYIISLNKNHFVYKAHFPGNPITPGACIIQICKELIEHELQRTLFIRKVLNVKFLSVIDPETHNTFQVEFTKFNPSDDGYKVNVLLHWEYLQFAKVSLFLQPAQKQSVAISSKMKQLGVCVIIPSYNNQSFLNEVLNDVLQYTSSVIVVNDGSTDGTGETLKHYRFDIETISYHPNRGKGYALRQGFAKAKTLGFSYALTMDSDGQHDAGDIPKFIDAVQNHPDSLIIGSRNLQQENMPSKNTFANKFSNFWFTVQTGLRLPDTQTGFRLYPLLKMQGLRPFSSRYEAELELLIRSAWRNIPLRAVPIQVKYLPEGLRVTHFRPGIDFLRISILNTIAVCAALCYVYPARLIRLLFNRP